MQSKFRLVVVSVVLTSLALMIGSASAQEAPTSPEVGVCLPGAGYAPGCDVDQDGDVDIFDIQLTAGRWNSSGIYTSGHAHWGETWTDATGAHGLRLEHTASSGFTYGLYGKSASSDGRGVRGYASAASGTTYGVYGESASSDGRGVRGYASASSGANYGVYGNSNSPSGYAGYFSGRVHVTGILSKGGGAFKIDHPLDSANQYLYHSFVESPDMKNIYDGVAVLDAQGEAEVQMPAWFEALNRDFRYQLTAVGAAMPTLYVAQEVQGNAFRIAGGAPGMKVSWQVTGIRQDAWANAHRIPVEEAKPAGERGLYLHPVELGQRAELGLDYQRNAGLVESPPPANTTNR
jgi:hypothetical protein